MARKKEEDISALNLLLGHQGMGSEQSWGDRLAGSLQSPLFLASLGLFAGGPNQLQNAFAGLQQGLAFGKSQREEQRLQEELARKEQLRAALAGATQVSGGVPSPNAPAPPSNAPPAVSGGMAGPPQPGQMRPPTNNERMALSATAGGGPPTAGGGPPPGAPALVPGAGVDANQLRKIASAMMTLGTENQQAQGLAMFGQLQNQAFGKSSKAAEREARAQENELDREFKRQMQERAQTYQTQATAQAFTNKLEQEEIEGKRRLILETLRMGNQQNIAGQRANATLQASRERIQAQKSAAQSKLRQESIDQAGNLETSMARLDNMLDASNKTTNVALLTPMAEWAERNVPGVSTLTEGRYTDLDLLRHETVLSLMDVLRGLGQMSDKELRALQGAAPKSGDREETYYRFGARSLEYVALSLNRLAQKAEAAGDFKMRNHYLQQAAKVKQKEEEYGLLGG